MNPNDYPYTKIVDGRRMAVFLIDGEERYIFEDEMIQNNMRFSKN